MERFSVNGFTIEELCSGRLWCVSEDLRERPATKEWLGYPFIKSLAKEGLLFRKRKEARDTCNRLRKAISLPEITSRCEEHDMILPPKETLQDSSLSFPRESHSRASASDARNQGSFRSAKLRLRISRRHDGHSGLDLQVHLR